jgi:hypothetical protein
VSLEDDLWATGRRHARHLVGRRWARRLHGVLLSIAEVYRRVNAIATDRLLTSTCTCVYTCTCVRVHRSQQTVVMMAPPGQLPPGYAPQGYAPSPYPPQHMGYPPQGYSRLPCSWPAVPWPAAPPSWSPAAARIRLRSGQPPRSVSPSTAARIRLSTARLSLPATSGTLSRQACELSAAYRTGIVYHLR